MFQHKQHDEFDIRLLTAMTEALLTMNEAVKSLDLDGFKPEHRQAAAMQSLYVGARKSLPKKVDRALIGILHAAAATTAFAAFGVKDNG